MSRLTIKNSDGTYSQPTHTTFEKMFYKLAQVEDLMEELGCDSVEQLKWCFDNQFGECQALITENTELKKKLEIPRFSQYQQVWYISKLGSIIGKWNYECESKDGYILNKYSYKEDKRIYCKQPKDMVFATKEEAEQRLKELKGE